MQASLSELTNLNIPSLSYSPYIWKR